MPTRLLFVGRREAAICRHFEMMREVEIGGDGTTQDDIREFVEATVDNLVSDYRVLEPSKERLKEGLLRMAGNMFLFVKLKEDAIRCYHPSSPSMVEELVNSLDDIPPGLEEMYESLLLAKCAKWNTKTAQIAVRSLTWLLYSRTPVTRNLLRVVVAIDTDSGVLRVDHLDSCIEKTVKHALGALIDWQEAENGVLCATLVHPSLSRYLISCVQRSEKVMNRYQISPDHLFKTCCAVLASSAVRQSLRRYHISADRRRQIRSTEFQRVLCQEEEWERWEQRQMKDLVEDRQRWVLEKTSMQDELNRLRDAKAPLVVIESHLMRLNLLQRMIDGGRREVQKLEVILHMPEHELMVYALK